MTDPGSVMVKLDGYALELDDRSKELAETSRELDDVEQAYEAFVDDYETGLWDAHVKDEAKLPSESMRLKLAHRAMDPDLLGRYSRLVRKRKRLQERISALKADVSAQQSILSALKTEAEAGR